MKKTASLILLILAAALALCGCRLPDPFTDPPAETEDETILPSEAAVPIDDTDPANDHDNRSFGVVYFQGWSYLAEHDGVLYYPTMHVNKKAYLNSYNETTGEIKIMCSDPDCPHMGSDCCAYGSICPQYYDGKIYFMQQYLIQSKCNFAIYRMDLDGSDPELIRLIIASRDPESNEEADDGFIMHRGRMYVLTGASKAGEPSIKTYYLKELLKKDGEHRIVFQVSYPVWSTVKVFMYDNFAYIAAGTVTEDGNNVVEITKVDLATGDNRIIFSDGNAAAYFSDNCWVERDGTIWFTVDNRIPNEEGVYVSTGVSVYKSGDRRIELVKKFEDGEIAYDTPLLSQNICGALHEDEDGSVDIWLCDFEGNTLYKGPLDIDCSDYFPEGTEFRIVRIPGIWGSEKAFIIEVVPSEIDENGDFSFRFAFMVRYEITPEGLNKTVLLKNG